MSGLNAMIIQMGATTCQIEIKAAVEASAQEDGLLEEEAIVPIKTVIINTIKVQIKIMVKIT